MGIFTGFSKFCCYVLTKYITFFLPVTRHPPPQNGETVVYRQSQRPNGYFITGRGCGGDIPLKYLDYIPNDLEKFQCSYITLKSIPPGLLCSKFIKYFEN